MILADEQETLALGRALGAALRIGDIVCLTGGLGVGKTVLARGMLRGLGYDGEATSPTFALLHSYAPPDTRIPLAHADLYRIEEDEELTELGLDDAVAEGALIVEWPERIADWAGEDALHIAIERDEAGRRILTARPGASWKDRWPPA